MKKNNIFTKKILSVFMAIVLTLTMAFAITSSAVSESDYKATFRVETDKLTVSEGENVTVSVSLKTNYYIFAMEVPVIYDAEAFELQNTSATNSKSFLDFQGKLSDYYTTNGTWKSPNTFYSKSNSNPVYWSNEVVKARYKIAFASWAADTSKNNGNAIMLDTEETIVSFVLKAKKDISDMSGLIFISDDFKKTKTFPGGKFFCGRSVEEKISVLSGDYVTVGQTIEFDGVVPEMLPVGCGNKHNYVAKVTSPTCMEMGYTTYTCSLCAESYIDSYTDAIGHIEGEWKVTTAPTYEAEGEKSLLCAVCGEILKSEPIDVLKAEILAVKLDSEALLINRKDTVLLTPEIEIGGTPEYTVKYSSSNEKIATVDSDGNVTGNLRGSAVITCTVTDSNGKEITDTCDVTVNFTFIQWVLYIVFFGWIWM